MPDTNRPAATTATADCPECLSHPQLTLLDDGGAICPNCDRWWSDARPLIDACAAARTLVDADQLRRELCRIRSSG